MYRLQEILKNPEDSRIAFSEVRKGKLVELTYSQINKYSDNFAQKLKSMNIKIGSKIAIKGENSVGWIIAFFGILKSGHICVPIDYRANEKTTLDIINLSESSLLISNDDLRNKHNTLSFENIIEICKQPSKEFVIPKIKEEIAVILYTSGTTGSPKGVMLSHNNLISNLTQISNLLKKEGKLKSFSVLPLSHVYELTCNALVNINLGNSIHFCSGLDLRTISKELNLIEPNIFPVVPLLLEKIYQGINKKLNSSSILSLLHRKLPKLFGFIFKKKLGLKRLRFFFCGGAALSPEIENFFDNIGLKIIQGYGLSEASPLVSVNPLERKKVGSVGKVIDGCNVKIDDSDQYGNGTIKVKGPNIFEGYYKNEDATSETLQDEYLNTGDIGRFDSEGYLYITGREKFVIISSSGENIYPEEIEEMINIEVEIEESIVFSVDQKKILTLIKLSDEFNKISHKRIIEIVDGINNRTEKFKRISGIYLTDISFEKTSTQKIKRGFLNNINLDKYEKIK